MTDGEDGGDGHLHWALGLYDERTDHSGDYRDWAKLFAALAFILVVFSYAISPGLEREDWPKIIALWLGVWLLVAAILTAWFVTLSRNRYHVYTLVDLPPDETSRTLERALEGGVPELSRVDRVPWLHGEVARFKVTMDWEGEAMLAVKLRYQSRKGPTCIHVRSSRNRDEWQDLRGLVEDVFRDVAVQAPPEGTEFLDGYVVPK